MLIKVAILCRSRRFSALNMQDLLLRQAEIANLESDLREAAERDSKHVKRENHAHDWWSLSHGESEGDQEQWRLILEIQEKLEKYSERA